MNYYVSDLTMLKIVSAWLLIATALASSVSHWYYDWHTSIVSITGQQVVQTASCNTPAPTVQRLDMSSIIAKASTVLTAHELSLLAQHHQALVSCNSFPTTTTYHEPKCTYSLASYCWDGVVDSGEECDGNDNSLFICSASCTMIMKEQPRTYVPQKTYAPVYNYDVIAPSGWSDNKSVLDMYSNWF